MRNKQVVNIDLSAMEPVSPVPILNLPDLSEVKCYQAPNDGAYMVFECKPTNRDYRGCPHCGSSLTSVHGKMKDHRLVHDVNVGVIQIDLLVEVPRYRCEDCGRTFNHRFKSIQDNRQVTNRLYEQIRRDTFSRPFADIADQFGYTPTTVANIFDEYAAELEAERNQIIAPRVLGIDEKHIVRNMRGVFVDVENGSLLEMTATNKKEDIISTIEHMENYDKNIEIVTMDMSCGYKAHVQECLPNAKIVVDHYHVIQDLGKKVSATKTRITEYLNWKISIMENEAEKNRLKAVMNQAAKSTYLFKYHHKKLANDPERLKAMADVCKEFREFNHLRLLKEGIERLYECEDRSSAEAAFAKWLPLVPPQGTKKEKEWEETFCVPAELFSEFKALKNTMAKNWHEEIFAYFEEGCRVTNAATEGFNNYIERINRSGNGYSFTRLRAKALLEPYATPCSRFVLSRERKPIYEEMSFSKHTVSKYTLYREPKCIGYEDQIVLREEKFSAYPEMFTLFYFLPEDLEDN